MNDPSMTDDARDYLMRQFETAWKLTSFHSTGSPPTICARQGERDGRSGSARSRCLRRGVTYVFQK